MLPVAGARASGARAHRASRLRSHYSQEVVKSEDLSDLDIAVSTNGPSLTPAADAGTRELGLNYRAPLSHQYARAR